MLGRAVNRVARRFLESRGYWVRSLEALPIGVDYLHDIERLCSAFDYKIETVFDVGANVGQSSEAALSRFPKCRAFAFEPQGEVFEALRKRIVDPRFRSFQIAMSDHDGEATFYDYGGIATAGGLVENTAYDAKKKFPRTSYSVPCATIDAFASERAVERIDLLKVDTEGHDLSVLRGAAEMLRSGKIRFVYVEFNTLQPMQGVTGGALAPISELLEPMGFKFVATYPELMLPESDLFMALNALFVRIK